MTILQVKELVRVEKELRLVRADKQRKAEAALAAARESLAQVEAEVGRAVGDAEQLAALEEPEAVAVAEVARLEAQAREVAESAGATRRMHDVKQGRTRLEMSVGTMGLRLFKGGKPVETLLYQDIMDWGDDGDEILLELQNGTQKVFTTSEASAVAGKMTEHAKALGAVQRAQRLAFAVVGERRQPDSRNPGHGGRRVGRDLRNLLRQRQRRDQRRDPRREWLGRVAPRRCGLWKAGVGLCVVARRRREWQSTGGAADAVVRGSWFAG